MDIGKNSSLGGPDPLARASEEPNILALQQEYDLAWSQDNDASGRIAASEQVRYTRWNGQSMDGLKHQELLPEGVRATPYDRAPDCRVNLVDGVIQDLVDRDYQSFFGAKVKVAPAAATRLSAAQAGEWRNLVHWMLHGPLAETLRDDVEFASQVLHTVGWVVLHPVWRKKKVLRLKTLMMDSILQLAARAPSESVMQQLPAMIADPALDEQTAEVFRSFFEGMKPGRAKRLVRELRENGQAEFPTPDLEQNVPELAVLVPWMDFILPPEAMANPKAARVMFRRKFFTTATIEETAAEEEWGAEFLAAALKTIGQSKEEGSSEEHDADENLKLIEIVYAYTRQTDEDGVPGIYCTVFSPHLPAGGTSTGKNPYGTHYLLDLAHGQQPFVFLTTEVTGRKPSDARGVPDIWSTQQNEIKQQRDATYVFSQMSTTPPLQKKGTQASKLPPEIGPFGIINNVNGGEWSWFPPPPGDPKIAFTLMELVRREVEDYHGIARPDLPPARWQPRQQRGVMRWLSGWGQALWQLSVLAYANLTPEEMQQILGKTPLMTAELVQRHHLMLWFDIRAMDPAWVETLLQNIAQFILPSDAAGVMDRSKLTQFALSYLDPTLAEELTSDMAGASQQLYKQVRDEVGSVMQGNEAMYVKDDPTAKAKLQFAQQIVMANPEYQAQLTEGHPAFNPRKRELMEKYAKNLGQSVAQQDNKVIGRIGVKPEVNAGY